MNAPAVQGGYMQGEEAARYFRDTMEAIRREIGKVVVGQDETVFGALTGLAAGDTSSSKARRGWARRCWCGRWPSRST